MDLTKDATLLTTISNAYSCKKIWQKDGIRILTMDDIGIQSAINLYTPSSLPFTFSQHFMVGLFFLSKVESALVLGLGGGGLPRYLNHFGVRGTAVDIDPQMPQIAREWFNAPNESDWSYVVDDARRFLSNNKQKFDYVLFDICMSDHSPAWLEHLDTLENLKAACADDGVIVFNYLLTDVAKFYVLFQHLRQVFNGQVAFMSIDGYLNIVIVAFPYTYCREKLGLQESKINSLVAKWRLDFEHMLTKMKKDTPKGSGIFC